MKSVSKMTKMMKPRFSGLLVKVVCAIGVVLLVLAAGPTVGTHAQTFERHWTQLKEIYGGGVGKVVVDAGGTLYCTAGGVWKSTDAGLTWVSAQGNLNTSSVGEIAAHPVTPNILYLATDQGLFKTTNGGASWLPSGAGLPIYGVNVIVIDPKTPDTVYIGTNGGGIYKSTDGGASWVAKNSGLVGLNIHGLAIDPVDTSRLYANTWRSYFHISTNGGESWTAVMPTWGEAIVVSRSDPNVVYATNDGYWSPYFYGFGVIKSINKGISWSGVSSPELMPSGLAVDPSNANVVYITGNGVYKSTNGAASWSRVLQLAGIGGINSVTINPANSSIVYAATQAQGVYKSTDAGANWVQASTGIANVNVRDLDVSSAIPVQIYAVVAQEGLLKSVNSGETWLNVGFLGKDIYSVATHPADANVALVGGYDSTTTAGIWKSTDGAATWHAVLSGQGAGGLAFQPLYPSNAFAVTADWQGGILKSTNSGDSWFCPQYNYIYPSEYAFHPTDASKIWVGYSRYWGGSVNRMGIAYSTNGGATWSRVEFGYGGVSSLVIDPNNPTIFYAACPSGIYGGVDYTGVWKSTNSGVNWVKKNTGLSNTHVNKLVLDRVTGWLYAATPRGVFLSKDGAENWASISPISELPHQNVSTLALTPDGKRLYAGTNGGIYVYAEVSVPTQYTLTVNISGPGSVTKTPDQPTYPHGTNVTLTATASTGSVFAGWSGDLSGYTNPTTIIMDANKTVTATFTTPTVTVHDVSPHVILLGRDANSAMWDALNRAERDKAACDEIKEAESGSGTWDWPPIHDHIWLRNGHWVQVTSTINARTVYIQFPYSDSNDHEADIYVDGSLVIRIDTNWKGWWFLEIGNLPNTTHTVKVVANPGDVHLDFFGFGGTFIHPSVSPASIEAGQTVTLSARLTRDGSPVSGKNINFYKDDGEYLFDADDTLLATSGSTDAGGNASASYVPTAAGTYFVWARYAGDAINKAVVNDICTTVPDRASFTVVSGSPTSITMSPTSAENVVGTNHTVTATVKNAQGVPIPGQAVTWTIQSGPGTIVSSQATTDQNGQASTTITSTQTGNTVITATAGSVSGQASKKWNPGRPANLTLLPATAQNVVGSNHNLTATVTDQYGNAVPGAPVGWSLAGVGGFVGTPDGATDSNGQAKATISSTQSGQTTVTASVTGTNLSATATKTWKPGPPASVTLLPATAQNVVGTNHNLTATVTDQYGNAVPGAPVGWSLAGVGGFVGTPDGATDSNGQAKATISSTQSGQTTVTASVTGTNLSATATKTWKPGPPASITLSPASAENIVGTNHTMTATVKDNYGNVIPSQAVAWSIQSRPGTIVSSQATTDQNGQASATITSNDKGTTVTRATAGSVYGEATKTWKPISVSIDIKPGSFPNSVNLGSKGVIPVAILTTPAFNAATVDPLTVKFAGAKPVRWTMEDVDNDGDKDMLFHFNTQDLNLTANSTSATLTGKTLSGLDIEGTDSVRIAPPTK